MERAKPRKTASRRPDVDQVLASVAAILAIAPERLDATVPGAALASMVRRMAEDGHGPDDPIREVFARLGDKWSMLLLLLLQAGKFRHATLRRLAGAVGSDAGISQRMLTLRLRSLERDGLVARTTIPTVPPQVEYSLTRLGVGLLDQVDSLMGWVRAHSDAIRLARTRFAEANDSSG